MPVLVRRRPSMDLRKAAKVALSDRHHGEEHSLPSKQNHAADADSVSIASNDVSQKSDSEMEFPTHKLANLPSRQKSRKNLRLTTSSPVLHQHYQSDEEQPSPSPDENSEIFQTPSKGLSLDELDTDTDDVDSDSSSSYDDSEDEDTNDFDLATPRLPFPMSTISPSSLAVAITILSPGPARLITISSLAPMQKRTTNILARPTVLHQSASLTAITKARTPRPFLVRPMSTYSSASGMPNFSTPLPPQRGDSLSPPSQLNREFSSPLSDRATTPSSDEEADCLMRESEEIQYRHHAFSADDARESWNMSVPPQLQMRFDVEMKERTYYDPFVEERLEREKLAKEIERDREVAMGRKEKAKQGWKALGMGMRPAIMGMKRRGRFS